MDMSQTQDRINELIEQLGQRAYRAEQALNRHGFKQDDKGEWKPPVALTFKGALELQQHLLLYFPKIATSKQGLHHQALAALEEAEQRRVDAFSEWMKSAMPSLKFTNISLTGEAPRDLLAQMERAQKLLNQCEGERRAANDIALQYSFLCVELATAVMDHLGESHEGEDLANMSGQKQFAKRMLAALKRALPLPRLPPTSLR